MPRPKVERVARMVRLPADVDAELVTESERSGLSVNLLVQIAVEHSLDYWQSLQRRAPATPEVDGTNYARGGD